jgi:hypothetical protein
MVIKVKRGDVTGHCNSCGWKDRLDNAHKLAAYIIKNPPKNVSEFKKDEKAEESKKGAKEGAKEGAKDEAKDGAKEGAKEQPKDKKSSKKDKKAGDEKAEV